MVNILQRKLNENRLNSEETMKYKATVLLLSLLASAPILAGNRTPFEAQTNLLDKNIALENAPTIRVATFNMAASRVSKLTDIAKAIKAMDADVVALQEVDVLTGRSGKVDQAKELSKLTGYNVEFGRAIDFDGGQYGLAIMSKHEIVKTDITELPSGEREQRIAFEAHVRVPGFDVPVTIFNSHLDTKENPEIRLGQVWKLNDTSIDTRGIKILLGDMNDVPKTSTLNELSRYWNNLTENVAIDSRSWPAGNPEIQVDYIFTSKAQKWQVDELVVPQKNSKYAGVDWPSVTDHLPVIATLRMLEQ